MVEGGCNGTMRVEVAVPGVAAHSARAWMGENAIHSATAVLSRLTAYETQAIEVEGLVYRESLNAVLISGGVAANVIPDRCTITVNYRFAPSKTVADAEGTCASCSPATTCGSPMLRGVLVRAWIARLPRTS
jgi:succinyl-diaminopimelate desuccinylase